jgi:hypothetical protein
LGKEPPPGLYLAATRRELPANVGPVTFELAVVGVCFAQGERVVPYGELAAGVHERQSGAGRPIGVSTPNR